MIIIIDKKGKRNIFYECEFCNLLFRRNKKSITGYDANINKKFIKCPSCTYINYIN